jgi:GNAT superfamily N-acetyltransferase
VDRAPLDIATVHGAAITAWLPALAALRVEVFREFPYLYDGSLAYEERYLARYAASPASVVVLARDGAALVGAATAMPLALAGEDVAPPLVAAGYDPATVCYFGESVLRAAHRGRGAGHAFLDERERAARASGFTVAAFCAVERPADHPRRPAGYRGLDGLWQRHGFVRRPDLVASFRWQDLGEPTESAKPMVFWTKALT